MEKILVQSKNSKNLKILGKIGYYLYKIINFNFILCKG